MTREELFIAIGQVEESRLARSEMAVSSQNKQEDTKMKLKPGRIFRNLLVAAIIVSMLAVTAYAVTGFLIFDSPEEMIAGIFGDKTGYDHKGVTTWTDPEKPGSLYENPAYDRVPADETVVAEDIVPHVSPVGRVLTKDGYTLTVDAYMYDSTTRSGFVTYTLESESGLPKYEMQPNGELYFPGMPDPVDFNQYGKTFLIQEKTTEDKLAVTYYFHYDAAFNREFTVALGDYTDMTDEERSALELQCRGEVRELYTPAEALGKAEEEMGKARFAEYCDHDFRNVDSAYSVLATDLYIERLAAREDRDSMTEEEYTALFQQCKAEIQEQYPEEEAIAKARESRAYSYLSNELYFARADTREKIVFDCSEGNKLDSVAFSGGSVIITPISFQIDVENMDFLHETIGGERYIHADNVDSVVICYQDGTQYIVTDADTYNVVFGLGSMPTDSESGNYSQLNYMFNRIIDIEKVDSIIINGTKLELD